MRRQGHAFDIIMLGTFSAWGRGTIQSRAVPFARLLAREGHRVGIITTPWDMPHLSGTVDSLDGISVIHTTVTRLPLTAVREQLSLALAANPQVIHVIKPKGYGGLASFLVNQRRRTGPGLIVDADDWEGDGAWNDQDAYSVFHKRFFEWQEQDLLRRADHVIAASTLLERRARKLRRSSEFDDVAFVPNMLEDPWIRELAAARESPSNTDPSRVVLYSRFREFPHGWIDSFARALAERLESPAELTLIGIGDAEFGGRRDYGSLVIQTVGYLPRSELPKVLGRATVAVYPYEDSLITRSKQSVKLLELMAAGCAIVASDVGEIAPTLGNAGVCLRGHDHRAFAESVAALISCTERAQELGLQAQRRVRERFSPSAIAPALLHAYSHVGVRSA